MKTLTSKQKIFDHVIKHLRKQGRQSLLDTDVIGCAYRGQDGDKCAIGCLITDKEYDPIIENIPIDILLQCKDNLKSRLSDSESTSDNTRLIGEIKLLDIFAPKFKKLSRKRKEDVIDLLNFLQVFHDSYLAITCNDDERKEYLQDISDACHIKYVPSKKVGW